MGNSIYLIIYLMKIKESWLGNNHAEVCKDKKVKLKCKLFNNQVKTLIIKNQAIDNLIKYY